MIIFATIIFTTIAALYRYFTRNFDYWKIRNVQHDKPIPLFGNHLEHFLMRKSVSEIVADIYRRYPNERVVGFFRSTSPMMVIRDPELVKRIISTDFTYFYPRGLNPHKKVIEPLMRNLFFADGDLWRLLRQRMTPVFSSGKLKAMFPLIAELAEKLQKRALKAAADGRPMDARDLMARYTTDFIGACGFGLDTDSLDNDDSEFRRLGVNIFKIGVRDVFAGILKHMFPEAFKHLCYLSRVEDDIMTLVRNILKQRKYKPSGRNDFIDLLLECKQRGLIVVESLENVDEYGRAERATLEFTDEIMAAQVFIFFAAGFETSSSATSFVLHQLAYHPEVQTKVHAEIDQVMAKHNSRLSYDAIKEMKYLECAFKEGMRMFPSLGYLVRKCARPYTFADLNVSIDEGVRVYIPLQAMHNDPQYFDSPSQFRPERFLPEQFHPEQYKYIYLPFGEGPRACIGSRMGLMQSVAGLAALLARFAVAPAPRTARLPAVEPQSGIVQKIKGGLPLLFLQRKHVS